MDCGYRERTILYFYGELPAGIADMVREHVGTCASCSADLALLEGVASGLEAFRPAPPVFEAAGPAAAGFGGRPAFILRAATAGALAALFLAAFHLPGAWRGQAGWYGGIEEGLEDVSERILTLQDEMAYPANSDFDYACSDLEAGGNGAGGI